MRMLCFISMALLLTGCQKAGVTDTAEPAPAETLAKPTARPGADVASTPPVEAEVEAAPQPDAKQVLADALAEAKAQQKLVFLHFGSPG